MIPGKLYGKDRQKRLLRAVNGSISPAGTTQVPSLGETRAGIPILLRVLGRSRSEVAPHARMRLENS